MLVMDDIEIKIVARNISWYKKQGFPDVKKGDIIKVKPTQLPRGTHKKVKVICDYCLEEGIENIIEKPYYSYTALREKDVIEKDCCLDCVPKKTKESNLTTYGVESTNQVSEIREKFKETMIKRYGSTYSFQNEELFLKGRKTMVERYGVEYPMQSEELQEKTRQTFVKRYGVEHLMEIPEVIEKIKLNNLKKHGVEEYMQTDEFKKKAKKTLIKKYGVDHPMKSREILNRQSKTNFERYGVEYYVLAKDFWEKANETMSKNGKTYASTQQIEIYNMLKEYFNEDEICLNYPSNGYCLDIAFIKLNTKIDIEYDGWYWHQDTQKDERRNQILINNNWKVLRIKSGTKIPDFSLLLKKINKLIHTDKTYTEIKLDDWRDVANE